MFAHLIGFYIVTITQTFLKIFEYCRIIFKKTVYSKIPTSSGSIPIKFTNGFLEAGEGNRQKSHAYNNCCIIKFESFERFEREIGNGS